MWENIESVNDRDNHTTEATKDTLILSLCNCFNRRRDIWMHAYKLSECYLKVFYDPNGNAIFLDASKDL